jgi:hypothetical protein
VSDTLLDVAHATGLRTALYVGEHGRGGEFSVDVADVLRFVDAQHA